MAVIKNAIPLSAFPLKGATTILTDYNAQGGLDFVKTFVNNQGIAGTVSITQAKTSEEIPNERGEALTIASSRVFNVVVTMNTFNAMFHDRIANNIVTLNKTDSVMPVVETFVVANATKELKSKPAESNGTLRINVYDNKGNSFEKAEDETAPAEGQFKIDTTTKTITFDATANNTEVSVLYYRLVKVENYESKVNPVMTTKYMMMEFAEQLQAEGTDKPINGYIKLLKVTPDGDLPMANAQKSPNAPITYNFKTAPIPEGESPFIFMLENDASAEQTA